MLYTYVLNIVYVRHFKTKVERQCSIRCRHDGHILNQVCIVALLKRSVPSIFLTIMVVWDSLLSWTFVIVVVVIKMWFGRVHWRKCNGGGWRIEISHPGVQYSGMVCKKSLSNVCTISAVFSFAHLNKLCNVTLFVSLRRKWYYR